MAAIQKGAANMLRQAARPTLSRRTPALARSQSAGPAIVPDPPIPLGGIVFRTKEVSLRNDAIERDNPDYEVAVDYRTS